jgi:WhiB family transcriptional regulator, redox-sensing transcriptional regulator
VTSRPMASPVLSQSTLQTAVPSAPAAPWISRSSTHWPRPVLRATGPRRRAVRTGWSHGSAALPAHTQDHVARWPHPVTVVALMTVPSLNTRMECTEAQLPHVQSANVPRVGTPRVSHQGIPGQEGGGIVSSARPKTDFQHSAACRDEDPETFFPVGTTGQALAQIAEAKAVCARCRAWALKHATAGVWGGLTADERRALKTGRRGQVAA